MASFREVERDAVCRKAPTTSFLQNNPFQQKDAFPPFLEAITESEEKPCASMNLSIGAQAALNEHMRHVAKHGFDGGRSFDQNRNENEDETEPPSLSAKAMPDAEWDRLLESSLSHVSVASTMLCDAFTTNQHQSPLQNRHSSPMLHKLKPPDAQSSSTHIFTPIVAAASPQSIPSDEEDSDGRNGSSYFDSSQVWALKTPERNQNTKATGLTRRGGSLQISPSLSVAPSPTSSPANPSDSVVSFDINISRISGIAASQVSPPVFDASFHQAPSAVALFPESEEEEETLPIEISGELSGQETYNKENKNPASYTHRYNSTPTLMSLIQPKTFLPNASVEEGGHEEEGFEIAPSPQPVGANEGCMPLVETGLSPVEQRAAEKALNFISMKKKQREMLRKQKHVERRAANVAEKFMERKKKQQQENKEAQGKENVEKKEPEKNDIRDKSESHPKTQKEKENDDDCTATGSPERSSETTATAISTPSPFTGSKSKHKTLASILGDSISMASLPSPIPSMESPAPRTPQVSSQSHPTTPVRRKPSEEPTASTMTIYEQRRRYRTVVPVRVFLDSSDTLALGHDSFSPPTPDEEYARLYAQATGTNYTKTDE